MKSKRYIRQTTLKEFGAEAQQKLSKAKVLVIGVGGLGIPVLQYLNAMGVGVLGMVEQDVVDLSNLQRQVLYSEPDIGAPKLQVALEKLKAQNSETTFKTYDTFLTPKNALEIIADFDLVVDASDNFATRYLVNDACVILKKPFIYGALHSFEGQVSVFNYQGGPTYRCLFPNMPNSAEIPNCNDNGVLGVVPGIVGNLQALEAVKVITGIGENLSGTLLLFNGLQQSYQKIKFQLQPENLNIKQLQETYEDASCVNIAAVSLAKLQELLKNKADIQLIDVRTENEYEDDHLEGSINIPLVEVDDRLDEINPDKPIYMLCETGKRSKIAIEILMEEFEESTFYNVDGGMSAL